MTEEKLEVLVPASFTKEQEVKLRSYLQCFLEEETGDTVFISTKKVAEKKEETVKITGFVKLSHIETIRDHNRVEKIMTESYFNSTHIETVTPIENGYLSMQVRGKFYTVKLTLEELHKKIEESYEEPDEQ